MSGGAPGSARRALRGAHTGSPQKVELLTDEPRHDEFVLACAML